MNDTTTTVSSTDHTTTEFHDFSSADIPNPTLISIHIGTTCKDSRGIGGWAAILSDEQRQKSICGGEPQTTSSRMAMTAAVHALECLKHQGSMATVFTDIEFLTKGMNEWISGWKSNGWKNASGKPVKNIDLWERLDELNQQHQVIWKWVSKSENDAQTKQANTLAVNGVAKAFDC